jgi:hypothetical protein
MLSTCVLCDTFTVHPCHKEHWAARKASHVATLVIKLTMRDIKQTASYEHIGAQTVIQVTADGPVWLLPSEELSSAVIPVYIAFPNPKYRHIFQQTLQCSDGSVLGISTWPIVLYF